MGLDIEVLAENIYNMVADPSGEGKYKPQDVFKVMITEYKDDGVKKKDCKAALKTLIDKEKLVYTVLNGSCTSMVGMPGCEK